MKYQLEGNALLVPINRADIIDINPGDTIEIKSFPGAAYAWTSHDAEFMENNPDDDIFLEMTAKGKNFTGSKIIFR